MYDIRLALGLRPLRLPFLCPPDPRYLDQIVPISLQCLPSCLPGNQVPFRLPSTQSIISLQASQSSTFVTLFISPLKCNNRLSLAFACLPTILRTDCHFVHYRLARQTTLPTRPQHTRARPSSLSQLLDAFPTSPCLDHTRQHRQGNKGHSSRNHQIRTPSSGQELSSQSSISSSSPKVPFAPHYSTRTHVPCGLVGYCCVGASS